jgi:hypothetical protein
MMPKLETAAPFMGLSPTPLAARKRSRLRHPDIPQDDGEEVGAYASRHRPSTVPSEFRCHAPTVR